MTSQEAIQKVLNVAISNIGYKETSNNVTKFAAGRWDNEFYGWELTGQPWCDVFADYCYCEAFGIQTGASITYQRVGGGSALCRTSAQYYKNNNAWYTTPQPGDQIFFYYDGDINHTGIVESVSGTQVITIEGNTSDMVARRYYNINNSVIAGYGRPRWELVTDETTEEPELPSIPTPTPTPTLPLLRFGMRKSQEVKELQENLIRLGYNLGSWGADGDFGYDTLVAVKKFQKDYNLEIDGIVGEQTRAAIKKALADKTGSEQPTTPTTPTTPVQFEKGDKVKIKEGSTYYNSNVKVPQFVLIDTWIIYSISGDRAVINKNISGTTSIMSPVNINDLVKI